MRTKGEQRPGITGAHSTTVLVMNYFQAAVLHPAARIHSDSPLTVCVLYALMLANQNSPPLIIEIEGISANQRPNCKQALKAVGICDSASRVCKSRLKEQHAHGQ